MCLLKEGSEEKRLRFERVASVWVCCFLRVTAKKKVCDYWNGEVPRGKESEKIKKVELAPETTSHVELQIIFRLAFHTQPF